MWCKCKFLSPYKYTYSNFYMHSHLSQKVPISSVIFCLSVHMYQLSPYLSNHHEILYSGLHEYLLRNSRFSWNETKISGALHGDLSAFSCCWWQSSHKHSLWVKWYQAVRTAEHVQTLGNVFISTVLLHFYVMHSIVDSNKCRSTVQRRHIF